MEKSEIERINILAKKASLQGLCEEEREEQKQLREKYIMSFKSNLSAQLDSIVVKHPDGSVTKIKDRKKH